jgi:hypothetical protein
MNQIHARLPEWNEQPPPASGPYADLASRIFHGLRERLTRRHTEPPAATVARHAPWYRFPRRPRHASRNIPPRDERIRSHRKSS